MDQRQAMQGPQIMSQWWSCSSLAIWAPVNLATIFAPGNSTEHGHGVPMDESEYDRGIILAAYRYYRAMEKLDEHIGHI